MKRFKFKKKYRFKYKTVLILFLYLLFGFIGFILFCNLKLYSSNEEFILSLLTDSNHYKKYKYNWFNKFTNIIFSSEITKPTTLLESLLVSKDLSHYDEIYDADSLEEISQHIKDPNPSSSNKPVVYIYNSHQLENYSSTNYEAYNITPNVMMASYILREKLKEQGIEALVEESDITEFIRINNWNYNYSYMASRYYIEDAINKNESLKYFIDVHRDSINKNSSTYSLNNKNYAKVLFVVGLEHQNYNYNLELATYFNSKLNNQYPGLSRGIIKKSGANVNGIYNQDISNNAMLIEVGGYENTIDEVYNTMEILAIILKDIINERG